MNKKLIPKHLKGDSVKSEEIKILEDSIKEKKKLTPKKKNLDI